MWPCVALSRRRNRLRTFGRDRVVLFSPNPGFGTRRSSDSFDGPNAGSRADLNSIINDGSDVYADLFREISDLRMAVIALLSLDFYE